MTAVLILGLTTTIMAEKRTIELKIIETSDVHGHFFPYDFIDKKPLKGTLSRVSTYVQRQRQRYGERLLLIDNGDILQGQPTCYWSNYVATGSENIAASLINYMKYDVEAMGNHDVETGHKVYDKWIREVHCPMVGANIIKTSDKTPYVEPYSVHYKDGVKIVVIGLLTPTISSWLSESLWSGLEFHDMVSSAEKWVKYVQEVERPDLIVGMFHSGWDGGIVSGNLEENAVARVAKEVAGFDVIFYGHDHMMNNYRIKNKSGKEVVCLDPSCYALNVAEASITLTFDNGRLVRKDIKGEIVDVRDEQIDEQMVALFQPQIDQIHQYVDRKIGTFTCDASTRDCYFGPSAFNDFVHNLQLRISKAEVSFSAPLSFDSKITAGDVTVADMFKLYRFENQLYILMMKGSEIRDFLEMSYSLWVNTMTSKDDHLLLLNDESRGDQQRMGFQNYTFNFDSAAGIDYLVDVTKPIGQKVRILRMSDGTAFDEKKMYTVVMNSYRANGGGGLLTKGAGISKDEIERRIIYRSELDLRHYLIEEISKTGTVTPAANTNWKFVPEEWTVPAGERDRKLVFR